MKQYKVTLEVKIGERETISQGYNTHRVNIIPTAKNKLDAINQAIDSLYVVQSCFEEERISKELGREYKVKCYELSKIVSVEVYKG